MKRHIIFHLYDKASFVELTTIYFLKSGFKENGRTGNQLVFVKGSMLQNMVTFNPLNWKSRVSVSLEGDNVVAEFDIQTFGQIVSPKEENLWDTFISNYKTSLTTKEDQSEENQKEVKETIKSSFMYAKWAGVGAIVMGVPFGVLAYRTGVDRLALLGMAGGALLFMMYRMGKDRRKNTP